MDKALKFDANKPRTDLLPVRPLINTSVIFAYGSRKYADYNWKKGDGLKQSRVYAALLRHLFAWYSGEDRDKESGRDHLAHATCCLLMLYDLSLDRPNSDDRDKTR